MTSLSFSEWNSTPQGPGPGQDRSTVKRNPTIGKPIISSSASANSNPDVINGLLDQMNMEQHEEPMSTFDPIEPPELLMKPQKTVSTPLQPLHGVASAHAQLANYQSIYNQPTEIDGFYKTVTGQAAQREDAVKMDRYLEKLNYLIYLLEEQQKEQTGSVTEEFVLYCLFGVFVIFVVDAFARYGKNAAIKPRYRR